MERRRGSTISLLGLLLLACTQATAREVVYSGPPVVHDGQPWVVECRGLEEDDPVRWTRNGQSLEPELASGQLVVQSKSGSGTSKLSALEARENHDGDYKCTPESDNAFHLSIYVDTIIRVLSQVDTPMVMECANRTANDKVQWIKDSKPIAVAMADSEGVFRINNETGNLEILKEEEEAYGNYSCKVGNSSTDYRIVAKPTAIMPQSLSVVEGEKLHLVCLGKQSPGIKVSWSFGGRNYTQSEGRVKLARDEDRGIYGAVLNVENIGMADRGEIYCRVSYNWSDTTEDHYAEAQTLLRVKDKLAALWPFLGICAEVVVLCAIILIYEKKRNKAELEESDTDQSPDTKPTPNKDSDVRQRK